MSEKLPHRPSKVKMPYYKAQIGNSSIFFYQIERNIYQNTHSHRITKQGHQLKKVIGMFSEKQFYPQSCNETQKEVDIIIMRGKPYQNLL